MMGVKAQNNRGGDTGRDVTQSSGKGQGDTAFLTACLAMIDQARTPQQLGEIGRVIAAGILREERNNTIRQKIIDRLDEIVALTIARNEGTSTLRQILKQAIEGLVKYRSKPRGGSPGERPSLTENAPNAMFNEEELVTTLEQAEFPTNIVTAPPPAEKTPTEFDALLIEALSYKVGLVLTFFHRHNPHVRRALPRPFLLSAEIAERLDCIIRAIIGPAMLQTRRVRCLGDSRQWHGVSSAEFWSTLSSDNLDVLARAWRAAWQTLAPAHEGNPQQTLARKRRENHTATDTIPISNTQRLVAQALLRGTPEPRDNIDDPFILLDDTATSFLPLLLLEFERPALEKHWTALRQVYEQELDRRTYQDRAREGALRDRMLQCLDTVDDTVGQMLVILCYYCFPLVTIRFLDKFTHNRGSTAAERKKRMPLLVSFLERDGVKEIAEEEDKAVTQRQIAINDYLMQKKTKERVKAPNGAVSWLNDTSGDHAAKPRKIIGGRP